MRAPAAGAAARAVVRASDVHVSLAPPASMSADNALAGAVRECLDEHADGQTVVVDCGGLELVADVSRASAQRLALTQGRPVYAVFRAPRARPRGMIAEG
ncbi:MAG: TOBE domain-containing protein, partial [Pseudomonadota bacterium]